MLIAVMRSLVADFLNAFFSELAQAKSDHLSAAQSREALSRELIEVQRQREELVSRFSAAFPVRSLVSSPVVCA